MTIVGINFFFEHTSVSVIKNGRLVFSTEEERYNGIKGGKRYSPYTFQIPYNSLYAALDFLGLTTKDVDVIALSYNRWEHLKGLCSTRWSYFDDFYSMRNLFFFRRILCSDYESLIYTSDRIFKEDLKRIPILHFDHHLSHAASAYCFSGFERSLVFVADCCGEKSCTSLYLGTNEGLIKVRSFDIPNSLGMLYTIITKHLGFDSFKDEYKVMGLASYGRDTYRETFKRFVTYDQFGNYTIDRKRLFNLESILGPARQKGEEITQQHKDIAKTLQSIIEEIVINILKYYREKLNVKCLCMAGGVALNCVMNGKIYDSKIFEKMFVQPVSSDAGTSMGAAALAYYKYSGNMQILWDNMYLGREYSNEYIKNILSAAKLNFVYYSDCELAKVLALKLSSGQIGGLFRGRMEAGPRALGNRSIIANPIPQDTLKRINGLKGREMFRPIAPIVKEDSFDSYFEGKKNRYMLYTCRVKREVQELIPAITHVDLTSRVQTVAIESNPFLYMLLDEFQKISKMPILVNTSLNFRGKPIIESPADAIGSFFSSGLDFMVIGNFLLEK